jgi:hypothetical protein
MKPGLHRYALVAVAAPAIIGTALVARFSGLPAGADITEGGSPLYRIAVEESVKGLRSKQADKDPARNRPCPKCGKVHAPPAPADNVPCPKCGKIHPAPHGVPASGAAAHSAAGGSRDYVYCPRCKVYHRRRLELDPARHGGISTPPPPGAAPRPSPGPAPR